MESFFDGGCDVVIGGGRVHVEAGSITGVSIGVGVGVDATSLDVDSAETGQS